MKKLLIIAFITGFVGLGFAFSPSKVVSSKELNKISLLDDSTRMNKKTKCNKKSCCKKSCTMKCDKSGAKETPTK